MYYVSLWWQGFAGGVFVPRKSGGVFVPRKFFGMEHNCWKTQWARVFRHAVLVARANAVGQMSNDRED